MMDDGNNVVVLHDDEFAERVLKARLDTGKSIKRLAREFQVSERAILAALNRALPPLNPETRVRLFKEDLQRLDALATYWHGVAMSGGSGAGSATQLTLRIMERRAALCGLDAPLHARLEIAAQQAPNEPSSTQALLEQLERIVAERPAPACPIIEGGMLVEGEPPKPAPA
jgi:hypothetical protein